ncbi:putative arrestin domain-containing protein [Leptomonas pyrrhocoris]|uniref:Putative arrestin domain-containing protein n=1 Tax=Leptomonas pyrrhocoris TaxID=157538 RepID=A0A0M9FZ46_LEPPY|nr:putative arrestin domain-containing protein [Leptomonas pyrrhocoris]KPA78943.1 putative arrestin domain-containing protein [Leptomonas pyrrhocoris]|eukprot:XP_015657382.1 putative arrestin domain-containing protein [Leptomonas pyrrhocoris]
MSMSSSSLVKCEVHLTHKHFYPGDAVEGAVVIDAAAAFDVFNVHIKIVGKEEVYTMVDQVKESKIKNVQFGISSQDYVYYREIVTIAGALMTMKDTNKGKKRPPYSSRRGQVVAGEEGEGNEDDDSDDVDDDADAEPTAGEDQTAATEDGDGINSFRYNESIWAPPGVAQQNRSFAVSQLAAEEGVSVRFPAGHYVYPFRFLLSASLPPNYDTGICVKDSQFSNSQAVLHYYVKVYVWSPSRVQIASARADFIMGAMQPEYGGSHTTGNNSMINISNNSGGNGTSGNAANLSLSAADGNRAKLRAVAVPGKTVKCVFPVMGMCSCMATDAKLHVAFTIPAESFQIERDAISVSCAIASNTSKKAIRGLKVQLVQILKFETTDALVTIRKTVAEASVLKAVKPGRGGTIAGSTKMLESREDFMPTMKTSGLEVGYVVRVELLASHIDQAYYEFEGIQVAGAMMAGSVPPVGPMRFTALPRGRLTQREAFYAVPTNPAETPLIANLSAPLSRSGSRAVSRRTSRMNSRAPTPRQK